jgi:hypothetical protein
MTKNCPDVVFQDWSFVWFNTRFVTHQDAYQGVSVQSRNDGMGVSLPSPLL